MTEIDAVREPSLVAAPVPRRTAQPGSAVAAGTWISSAQFDVALLLAGPMLGLLTVLAGVHLPYGALLITALAYLVGVPHYLSTFVFFLGDDQRAHYLARPFVYLGVPLLIVGSVAAFRLSDGYLVVLAVIFVWNIWHVSMQSAGVLSIYRHANGGPASEKSLAHGAIFITNAGMAFWFADRFEPLSRFTAPVHPDALRIASIALLMTGGVLLVRLAGRMRSRGGIAAPELLALSSGVLLFHPLLWIPDLELATFGMLIGHFVQYLALVWLIQARKFGSRENGSAAQRALHRVSRNPLLIVVTIVSAGGVVFAGADLTQRLGQGAMLIIFLNSLALVHFYLDGLIWAFKHPHVRQTLGPYLSASPRRPPHELSSHSA